MQQSFILMDRRVKKV
nr:unnamed protein product [Callosobruchus analis]CAI5847377.1 unnamed protein product [Callosobruchus analis]